MNKLNEVSRSRLSGRMQGLGASLNARIMAQLENFEGELYPFQIGETHLLPAKAVLTALADAHKDQKNHRYGHPQGILELRSIIAQQMQEFGMPVLDADDVVITHGGTHGLFLACQAVLDPGDVVMTLSPHWPLIRSMIHTTAAVSVDVPFYQELQENRRYGAHKKGVYEILEAHYHPRTRALYICSPNNPDGTVLSEAELQEVARFCCDKDIYVISDEAYHHFTFIEKPPRLAFFKGMHDRTISIFTFSKSHRMTGLRVGSVIAAKDITAAMVKMANLSIYNVSLLTQKAALAAMLDGEKIVSETINAAKEARVIFLSEISKVRKLTVKEPEGGAYFFLNLEKILKGRACLDLLDHALQSGVIFAPGQGFGQGYAQWARFCYTAMEPTHLKRGCEKLVKLLNEF